MLKKYILIATGVIGLFVSCVFAQTTEINVALQTWGSRAIASSSYAEPGNDNYGPNNALDGRFAARETDKWNSAEGQQHPFWLIIDFGRERAIHKIVVRHDDGAVTSDFQLQWGDGKTEWKDIVPPIVSNKEAVSTHVFNPVKMRFLRLFIIKGEPNGNAYARIFEVEAYAQADTLGADGKNSGNLFTAFALERAINSGKWTEEQFKQAAALLKDDDLFVRALADFAVSEAVGQKNNGQTVTWTAEQLKNEPWFETWSTTSHEQKIIYDYIRHLFL
ncbi:MAG: discoidin domain-containing protein, partial [bacterium]